jgi:hypothetical protein
MAKKVSEKFRCPHCRALLTKSPMALILGRAAGFVALGQQPPRIICPSCGGWIDGMAMISGQYDVPAPSGLAALAGLGFLVGGTALLHTQAGLGLWGSLGLTLLALFVIERGFSKVHQGARRS